MAERTPMLTYVCECGHTSYREYAATWCACDRCKKPAYLSTPPFTLVETQPAAAEPEKP